MSSVLALLIDALVIALILAGVRQFRSPGGALRGNLTAALAMLLAVTVVSFRYELGAAGIVLAALVAGSLVGWAVAVRVSMVQIPAMVAFQHGAGGVAAFLVSGVELMRVAGGGPDVEQVSGFVGLVLGSATFAGSLVAAGKLANRLRQTPTVLPGHGWWVLAVLGLAVGLSLAGILGSGAYLPYLLGLLVAVSAILGVLVSIRIGGADMPVLISFLNATAGLAAAFCGIVIGNRLLVAAGATVAASGSILTLAMCRGMNRDLTAVFRGFEASSRSLAGGAAPLAQETGQQEPEVLEEHPVLERAVDACLNARSVIFTPGYGMALAGAQFAVVALGRFLEERGTRVRYAVHPVAGRMPGHMHVLLAEAEAPWDQLIEPAEANPEFASTDLVIVVGASDVVNPAAQELSGTPISGMPILTVADARKVLVINLDNAPGYSGVRNLLYDRPQVILMWGDAAATVQVLLGALAQHAPELTAGSRSGSAPAA